MNGISTRKEKEMPPDKSQESEQLAEKLWDKWKQKEKEEDKTKVNFNTILMFLSLGLISWIGVTTQNNNNYVNRLQEAIPALQESVKELKGLQGSVNDLNSRIYGMVTDKDLERKLDPIKLEIARINLELEYKKEGAVR